MRAASKSGLAGTIEYLAPELLLGEPASVASDLYSVGVMAYQMFTGNFPYGRDSMTRMLNGILGTSADMTLPDAAMELLRSYKSRPQVLVDSVPTLKNESVRDVAVPPGPDAEKEEPAALWPEGIGAPLVNVVTRLLARDPQKRYADAQGVLPELAAAVGLELPISTAATRESFLQATQLIGREAELELLQDGLAQAVLRQGSGFLLGGESGVGKSRLIRELKTLALVHECWVAEGQSATESGSYYQEWLPLLAALCFRTEMSDLEAAVVKDLLPAVGELLGRPIPDAPEVKPAEVQARLLATLLALLSRLEKPLLFILEDLQWVRSESLGLLVQLSSHLASLPLLLVGTFRSDESKTLPKTLPALRHIELDRLQPADIGRLSASILGAVGEKEELVSYLSRQTEGNGKWTDDKCGAGWFSAEGADNTGRWVRAGQYRAASPRGGKPGRTAGSHPGLL